MPALVQNIGMRLISRGALGEGLSNDEVARTYERYARLIRGWAVRLLRDRFLAEDMLHEVMVTLLHKGAPLLGLENEGSRRQWLRTTTVRICLKRQSRRTRECLLATQAQHLCSSRLEAPMEERNLFGSLLAELGAEERVLAVLHFEDGFTKAELRQQTQRSRPFSDMKLKRITCVLGALRGPSERKRVTSERARRL